MSHLIWNDNALKGLRRCYKFLALKNPVAAERAVRAIREGMQIVVDHPGVGRPVKMLDQDFREWTIAFGDSGYVVRYRLRGDQAVVVAVKHQRESGFL